MRNWLRGKRRGLISFVIICGLLAGGLGWATSAALRLEGEQHEARLQAEQADRLRVRQRELEQGRQALLRERAQQEAQLQDEFAAKLRLALWRLDSRIAPVLAREDVRPYNNYSAVFAPPVVVDPQGHRYPPAVVLEPSPLLSADLPEWMLLHFQTSTESGWGSPQVLSRTYQRKLAQNGITFANVTNTRGQLLDELSSSATCQVLLGQVKSQEPLLAAVADLEATLDSNALTGVTKSKDKEGKAEPLTPSQSTAPATALQVPHGGYGPNLPAPNGQMPGNQQAQQTPGAQTANPQRRDPGYGYGSRVNTRIQANNEGKLSTYADNAYNVYQNTVNFSYPWQLPPGASAHTARGLQEQVLVRMGSMTPFWLPAPEGKERLLVVRRVRISSRWAEQLDVLSGWPRTGLPASRDVLKAALSRSAKLPHPKEVCQGIVLDWPRLQKLLADEVRDLFPAAKILPMREMPPPHPERTMTALPAELDPGEGPAALPPLAPPDAPGDEPLAPAGLPALSWTPLRIGLALAWAAALVALAAVCLGGWSLIDLSERRIRFVSAVTHELRTPLTTLRLYLDMLTGGLVQGEEQKAEYLGTLHSETERLNRLVSNVLDFSRLEDQRPRLVLACVGVGELLDQVASTWQARCAEAGKELTVDNQAGPEAALHTDVQLVQQILGNLIDNACKYSRTAEDQRLWLRATMAGKRLVFEVEDRGPGVPRRERDSIFRAFCRGRSADVTAGGVGLGLALALRWAHLLGGRLTLCSPAEGSGACFRLELPAGTKA
jgi:signal transduction histidine kinase